MKNLEHSLRIDYINYDPQDQHVVFLIHSRPHEPILCRLFALTRANCGL